MYSILLVFETTNRCKIPLFGALLHQLLVCVFSPYLTPRSVKLDAKLGGGASETWITVQSFNNNVELKHEISELSGLHEILVEYLGTFWIRNFWTFFCSTHAPLLLLSKLKSYFKYAVHLQVQFCYSYFYVILIFYVVMFKDFTNPLYYKIVCLKY